MNGRTARYGGAVLAGAMAVAIAMIAFEMSFMEALTPGFMAAAVSVVIGYLTG